MRGCLPSREAADRFDCSGHRGGRCARRWGLGDRDGKAGKRNGEAGGQNAHDGQTALRGGARHRPQDRLIGQPAALLQALQSNSRREPTPYAFGLYAGLVTVVAAAVLVLLPWVRGWHVDAPALFAVLSGFVLAGELLPIPVPRRGGLARVTISAAFAFAILLRFGPGLAVLVYVASSVIADVAGRVAPLKVLFNAAQYLLAIVAAGRGDAAGRQVAAQHDPGQRPADRPGRGGRVLRDQPCACLHRRCTPRPRAGRRLPA